MPTMKRSTQIHNLATLARVYGERVRMPIYDRINAEGTFIF